MVNVARFGMMICVAWLLVRQLTVHAEPSDLDRAPQFGARGSVQLTPHILRSGKSGVTYFDGENYLDAPWNAGKTVVLPHLGGVIRDFAILRGQQYLFVSTSDDCMKLVADASTGATKDFSFSPERSTKSAVVDVARRRIFTLGYNRVAGDEDPTPRYSTLHVRDLEGKLLSPGYDIYGRATTLVRDMYCDTLVVGTDAGVTHVFRTTQGGFESLCHRAFSMGGVSGASCRGDVIAFTFDRGIKVCRFDSTKIVSSLSFPVDTDVRGKSSLYDRVFRSCVVDDEWAACSEDKSLYCTSLTEMKVVREVVFNGIIHGLCPSVRENEVVVLYETESQGSEVAKCGVSTVDLTSGVVNEDIFH